MQMYTYVCAACVICVCNLAADHRYPPAGGSTERATRTHWFRLVLLSQRRIRSGAILFLCLHLDSFISIQNSRSALTCVKLAAIAVLCIRALCTGPLPHPHSLHNSLTWPSSLRFSTRLLPSSTFIASMFRSTRAQSL